MTVQQTSDPAAWTTADLIDGANDFALAFDAEELGEIEVVLQRIRAEGVTAETSSEDLFYWPRVARKMQRVLEELRVGKGVVVLGDLPVEGYSKEELGAAYWGLGLSLGRSVPQSAKGDRLGHVRDMSASDPFARAYQNKHELTPHTDYTEVVGLFCLRDAREGGETPLASALAIHNEMVRARPDLMPRLYRGYRFHRRGEEQPGEEPITPHRVPIFSETEGKVSCRLIRPYITAAAAELGQPLADEDVEALDMVQNLARDSRFKLNFRLKPGQMVLFNNYTVLHGREPFIDHDAPEKKRHLLRLWLVPENLRPVVPEIELFSTKGGPCERETVGDGRVFAWGTGGR